MAVCHNTHQHINERAGLVCPSSQRARRVPFWAWVENPNNVCHFGFLFILFLLLYSLFGFLFILYLEFVVFSLPGGLLSHPKKIRTQLSLSLLFNPEPEKSSWCLPSDSATIEQAAVVIPVEFKYFVKFLSLFIFSSGSLYCPLPATFHVFVFILILMLVLGAYVHILLQGSHFYFHHCFHFHLCFL